MLDKFTLYNATMVAEMKSKNRGIYPCWTCEYLNLCGGDRPQDVCATMLYIGRLNEIKNEYVKAISYLDANIEDMREKLKEKDNEKE